MLLNSRTRRMAVVASAFFCVALVAAPCISAQSSGRTLYNEIKSFTLENGKADVSNLVLKRDRGVMTFNGTFYFNASSGQRVTGAVFIGNGTFRADIPPSEFEKNNVRRLLKADAVESDFKTAVLRFSDDTMALIGANIQEGAPPAAAQSLASAVDARVLEETGANLPSRLAVSILNGEKAGFFFAQFDGGKLNRFSYLFDPQNRIPTSNFDINGGEKGIIYSYKSSISSNEVWMAFYGEEDYTKNNADYSDINDLVDITHYDMDVDLTTPKDKIRLQAKITMLPRFTNVQAIPFVIGESLGEAENQRLKKQMRIRSVKIGETPVDVVQEDWEAGLTVFLPTTVDPKRSLELTLELEGDFLRQSDLIRDISYPRSNESWYPRHGYLDRSTYEISFRSAKRLKVACVGTRISEEPSGSDKDVVITKYSMKKPIALATFALGPFQRHPDTIKWDGGGTPIPLEFNSLPGDYLPIKEDFILAELSNSVRYFNELFGKYPYETFSATFHPYGFGQGFPTMLMIPPTDRASKYTYAFISHETAHQWWGNIVAWRSYRDQWLSEGFAEYSGALYTGVRESPKASRSLIDDMRSSLKQSPGTLSGIGKGRLADVGPIILGHRLNTTRTFGAYQTLIYNKGALVLRMLHFLLSDPSTGDDKAFFVMMKDFVERHRDGVASTDDFRVVANEHFAKSPIGVRYRLTDLNWFFNQWVYSTELPSYSMRYTMEDQPGGGVLVSGTITQEDAKDGWFMPLPVVFTLGGNRFANGTVAAYGASTPFKIKLPARPVKVELDPYHWVLSEKTETK